MQSAARPDPALLIVISGPPGSGKTTLAVRLSEELSLPLLAKDRVKEALADAVCVGADLESSESLGRAAYGATFGLARDLLAAGRGAIIESNFRRGVSEREIRAIGAPVGATRLVHCVVPRDVAVERYRSRFEAGERHAVHLDGARLDALTADLEAGLYEPLDLGCGTLVVETTSGYQPGLDAIVEFLRDGGAGGPAR